MKTIKIYILSFMLLSLGACKDFLELEPITSVTDVNYYKTPQDAYKALVGCYDGLQTVWADGISFPVASEVLSDNCFGGGGASDSYNYQMIDEFDKLRSPSDQNLFGPNWIAYYKAIYRCNVLISKIDQIDWSSSPDLRNVYESEVRFLRAYLYFDLVRLFGSIPLLTVPSAENMPQSRPDEVYKVIAEDLKFASDNLPVKSFATQDPTHGRVSKFAAEALLGRVFLYYTGYYGKTDLVGVVTKAEALAYLENVISAGGFGLVSDFASLWPASLTNYAGENNKETVFAIKYTYTSDYDGNTDGNHWMVMYGMREQFSYPYGNGWGFGTVNPKLYNAYLGTDARKLGSVIAVTEEKVKFTNQSKQREYSGYYVKKYAPLVDEAGNSIAVNNGAVNFMIGQFEDYVSIRYADVLLMAAELGSPNAQTYFDDVRRRAYTGAFTPLPVSQDNILKERRLEFAFEGIRYWDLLRKGITAAAQEIAENTTLLNAGQAAAKTILAAKITETKGLQQIPYNQITLSNGVLKQNAGW